MSAQLIPQAARFAKSGCIRIRWKVTHSFTFSEVEVAGKEHQMIYQTRGMDSQLSDKIASAESPRPFHGERDEGEKGREGCAGVVQISLSITTADMYVV